MYSCVYCKEVYAQHRSNTVAQHYKLPNTLPYYIVFKSVECTSDKEENYTNVKNILFGQKKGQVI